MSPGEGRLAFGVLGPLSVTLDGEPVRLGGPKERLVLAALLLASSRVVGAERLIDVLWDEEPPGRALATLQVHVSNLRRRLAGGTPTVITQPPGYALLTSAQDLDLLRFEELASLAGEALSQGDHARALAHYDEALDLWRGEGLDDLESVEFVGSSRQFLVERRLAVEEDRVSLLLALGRPQDALTRLGRLIEGHPHRESLWEHKMLALYRVGRQAEALAAYQSCRESLLDELGVEPNLRLRSLEGAILRQDPALDLDAPAPTETPAPFVVPDVTATVMAPRGGRAVLVREDGTEIPLDGVVVIGRHPECDVVVADPAVSRRHAEVRPALGGHLLSDLMSSNGTEVGDEQVMHKLLVDGDLVRVGQAVLRYVRTA